MQSIKRVCLAVSAAGIMSGCSLQDPQRLPASLDVDSGANTIGKVEPDVRRDSEAMHNYLVGQLSYMDEDFKGALDHFATASGLVSDPEPILHVKLAELYVRFGDLQKALVEADLGRRGNEEDSYAQLLYAGILVALDRHEEAKPFYRELIKKEPDKFDPYVLLASLHMERKEFDESLQVLTTLTTRAPKEPIGYYYLGRTYEMMDKLDKAEAAFETVRKMDPAGEKGLTDVVRVLVRQKRADRARKLCAELAEKDPNNATARKLLAQLAVGENKLDEALSHFQAAEKLEEDPTDTRFKIALIQIEKQNFREAVRELTLVLAKNPKHDEARYYLASLYAGSGRRKEAIEELLKVEKDSEMFVKSRTFAAFILRQDKDLAGAERAIRDALDGSSDKQNVLLYLTVILRDSGKYEEAEQLLREALVTNPNNDRLLFNYALVLHELKREDEALEWMEKLIGIHPAHSDGINFVAYSLAQRNVDLDRADKMVRKALELRPNDGYYLDTLGWVQYRQGRLAEAEVTLERAVAATEDDTVITEHYVEVLIANKKLDRAVSVLKAILDRDDKQPQDDKDKREAVDRMKRRLDDLLDAHPELKAVKKSQISPSVPAKKTSAVSAEGLEVPAATRRAVGQ